MEPDPITPAIIVDSFPHRRPGSVPQTSFLFMTDRAKWVHRFGPCGASGNVALKPELAAIIKTLFTFPEHSSRLQVPPNGAIKSRKNLRIEISENR